MENKLDGKLILGRAQGEHYLTVQLESAGRGTRGLVAVVHLKPVQDNQAQTATDRWISRLPSGSQLMTQTTSEDAGQRSTYRVVVNAYSEEANSERIKSMMHEDGLSFEHETVADGRVTGRRAAAATGGKTLFFKSPDQEAMAIIYRDQAGQTTIVLNTISRAAQK